MQKQLSELKESFSSINDQYPNVFDVTNSLLATSAKTIFITNFSTGFS